MVVMPSLSIRRWALLQGLTKKSALVWATQADESMESIELPVIWLTKIFRMMILAWSLMSSLITGEWFIMWSFWFRSDLKNCLKELFMSLLFSFKESNFCRKNNLSRLFSSENASVSIYSSYSNSALILISKTSPIIFFVFNILPFHTPLMYWLENGLQ